MTTADKKYRYPLRSLDEINRLGLEGKAFRTESGTFDLVVDSFTDLRALIDNADGLLDGHDDFVQEIRYFLIRRAKAMGFTNLVIPDTWNSDGSWNDGKRAFKF